MSNNDTYVMSIDFNVLNHLGINLYSNFPAVLSEIVANAWDADAKRVYVSIGENEITVIDDGIGMSRTDINNKYLKVGYPKREKGEAVTNILGRKVMGRKGIGKLSLLSIANTIEIHTYQKGSEKQGFIIDANDIKQVISDGQTNYNPKELSEADINIEEYGTKIILKCLKRKMSKLTSTYLKSRISRRFSIIGKDFEVFVNGSEVTIEDRNYFNKIQHIWYYGDESKKYSDYATNVKSDTRRNNVIDVDGDKFSITGWIGTVESSRDLKDGSESLNKITVLARGKVGQEDILSEYREGGLYSKYIIGEIHADFFDDDNVVEMATTDRQEFNKEDPRYVALSGFLHSELKEIERNWTKKRNDEGTDVAIQMIPAIGDWIESLKGDTKEKAKNLLGRVNEIFEEDSDRRKEILASSVLAFEKFKYKEQLSKIDAMSPETLATIGDILSGVDEVEATLYYQIVNERIRVIKKLNEIVDDNDKERIIQEHIFEHLWLIEPTWDKVSGSEYMEKTIKKLFDEIDIDLTDEEKRARIDIRYRNSANKHIIIELKRADRVISFGELVSQVRKYSMALKKSLAAINSNEAYEIIVVLGKNVENLDDGENVKVVAETLKPLFARVVLYDTLLNNAYNAYQAFLDKQKELSKMIDILEQI